MARSRLLKKLPCLLHAPIVKRMNGQFVLYAAIEGETWIGVCAMCGSQFAMSRAEAQAVVRIAAEGAALL